LTERKHNCFIENSSSNEGKLEAGVPQGSVLGPFLFLIFINDIADNLNSLTRLFADNTFLSYSSISKNTDRTKPESCVIDKWSKLWHVSFNPNKTDVILFNGNLQKIDLNLLFGDNILHMSDNHKHLGVNLSSNCKWSFHIDTITKSVSKHLSILRKLKYTMNKDTLSKLYSFHPS